MRQVAFRSSRADTSRLEFMLQRVFYTPVVRWTLAVVLPILLASVAIVYWLISIEVVQNASGQFASVAKYFRDRPNFALTGVVIEADSPDMERVIAEHVASLFPASPFNIDFAGLRSGILAAAPAVQRVDLTLNGDGLVRIAADGRLPRIVWRSQNSLVLLDKEGHFVGRIPSRTGVSDLKLIAGDGAELAVPEALRLYEIAEPIADMVRGLSRIGLRRWDVVLDTGQRILLPESEPERALERVISLNESGFLLNRRLLTVDMRDTRKVVVRAHPGDLARLRTPLAPNRK